MPRDQELITKRNADIKKAYEKMRAHKVKGKSKHHPEYILMRLSEKFYLSTERIERIVFSSAA